MMNVWLNRTARVGGGLALALMASDAVSAQDSNLVLAGYGSATYAAATDPAFANDFSASLSPVLLFTANENLLFEAELEFGLSGELTTTSLEYAQIDYLGFDKLQLVAGKFLLPFGTFGERLHPTWINKMPNAPLIFGHAHGGVVEGSAILPVLSDAGLMARFAQPFASQWTLDISGYVVQGPRLVADDEETSDGHAHEEVAEDGLAALGVPKVGFGISFTDNNKNKMLGGRVGLRKGGNFEAYVSGFHAMYDDENFLDYKGASLSAEWRTGLFELRGEGILVQQEFQGEGVFQTLERTGYYVQGSRRFGSWEGVVRWAQTLDAEIDGASALGGQESLGLGFDYWFTGTVPLKVMYEILPDFDDRVIVQWAFGF